MLMLLLLLLLALSGSSSSSRRRRRSDAVGPRVPFHQPLEAGGHFVKDVVGAGLALAHGGDDAIDQRFGAGVGVDGDADQVPDGGHLDQKDHGEGDHRVQIQRHADQGAAQVRLAQHGLEDVVGRLDGAEGQRAKTVWQRPDRRHGPPTQGQRVQQHAVEVVVQIESDHRVPAHVLVQRQQRPKSLAVPAQIIQKTGVDDERLVVVAQHAARFQAERVVRAAEDAEQRDLRNHPSVRHGAFVHLQKQVRLADGLHLGRHGRSAVRDAEVVIQHVQEVPQPGTLEGGFTVLGRDGGVEGFEEGLVKIEFGGHTHAVA